MDVTLQGAISLVFSLALFINALLFIPQAIKIFKEKSALGLSLWTFTGFLLTQLAAIFYGIIHKDTVLTVGYLLSLITCGGVVALALIYKTSKTVISLEEILKQLPSQVYWKDKAGRYIWRNDASLKYFRLANNGESRNKTDNQLFSQKIADSIQEIDNEVLQGAIKITEESLPSASGNKKSYLTYRIPLKSKNKNIIGLLGISFDFTEFKQIFIQQLHTLEHIIAIMPGNVYWVNKENVYQGCNNNQAKLSGLTSRKEIIGKRNADLPWNLKARSLPDDLDAINAKVMETGQVTIVEEPATLADGTQLMYLSTKAPIRDEKEDIIGMVGISVDITDRKKMEIDLRETMLAAEAASRAKSEFIANMSHDFVTPLTGIINMSADLGEEQSTTDNQQRAHWLNESGEQLLELCTGILQSVSADNYTEQDLNEECFSLHQLINAIEKLEKPMIRSKRLEFKVDIDTAIPSYLIADRVKLHRVLINLLGNAIKFTQTGYVGVRIKLLEKNNEQVILDIGVIDTGRGIAPDLQEKIFERFFRVNPSYKGTDKGYGIGLHIAQKYVHLLGGKDGIQLESEEGNGSHFHFVLSFKIGHAKDAIQIAPEQEQPTEIVRKMNPLEALKPFSTQQEETLPSNSPLVLLIEDTKPALLGLESIVKRAGCRFKSADDGEKGLELAKNNDFDLIITDIGLPGISGIEVTKQIRDWEKVNHRKKVPIVALTAHAARMAEPECLEAGMDKVFTKPANLDMVKNLIQQFISEDKDIDSNIAQQLIPPKKEEPISSKTGLGIDLPDTEEELFVLDQYLYLDTKILKEIYGDDYYNIVGEALESMPSQIIKDKKEIMDAFIANDWDKVEKLAHRAKGGAAACGTLRMKYACQYLERYHKAGHSKSLEKLYYQLINVLDKTKDYLDDWLSKHPTK